MSTSVKDDCFSDLELQVSDAVPETAYHQLANHLRDYIAQHDIPEGTPLPMLLKLSKRAGVSPRTMDRALLELIADGTCYRRPKKGTFVARMGASRARQRQYCPVYCHLGPGDLAHNLVRQKLHQGIEEACRDLEQDVLLINSDLSGAISTLERDRQATLNGVILLSWKNIDEVVKLARDHADLRFICLNYLSEGFENTPDNVYGIFNDDFAGGYQAGDMLIRRKHPRFAVFNLADRLDQNYGRRMAGFEQAIQEAGLTDRHLEKVFVRPPQEGNVQDQVRSAKAAADELFNKENAPTAIFCMNDWLAEGVATCLASKKLQEDIEIVGYDNLVSEFGWHRRFSTVSVDFSGMGRKAVALLNDDNASDKPKTIRLSPEIVARIPLTDEG